MSADYSSDLDKLIKRLKDVQDRLAKQDEVLVKVCGPVLRKSADQQFRRAGYPTQWKPLRPSTIARKANMGYPRKTRSGQIPYLLVQNNSFSPSNILIMTGGLRSSYTIRSDPFHVCMAAGGVLLFGSKLKYAKYHQSRLPRKKLPRRPVVLDRPTIAQCEVAVSRYALTGAVPSE